MSLAAMNHYWTREDDLSTTEAMVLLALADNANDAGFAFPSVSTLSAKCRMTDRGVQGVVERLVEKGELVVEERHRPNGSTTSNLYTLVDFRKGRVNVVHPPVNVVHPHNSNKSNTTTTTPAAPGKGAGHGTISGGSEVATIRQMVMSYFDGLRSCGKMVQEKNFPRYVRAAKSGIELGFTPEQVMAATVELSKQPFWSDKMVPLEKVVERLQAKPIKVAQPRTPPPAVTFIDPFQIQGAD